MVTITQIIGLILTAAVVTGVRLDGLRVKFGWSGALADVDYFFKLPRTILDAEAGGWRRTSRPSGVMSELRMYCTPGRNVCPLYDVGGFVAGLQIGFPKDEFESQKQPPGKKLLSWRALTNFGEPTRDFWYLPQFYVTYESLKAGSGPQIENGATLQEGGVWVHGPDGRLMRIPSTEVELNTTLFKKQNCIPNMGIHYYYNMTKDTKCENILPWFALVSDGELIGTGIQLFGRLTKQSFREWFETVPFTKQSAKTEEPDIESEYPVFEQLNKKKEPKKYPESVFLTKVTIPNGPPCLLDWSEYGVVSIHIYYVAQPWNIRCKDGDSIKPAPIMDRFLLNGYRYASAISDNVKKVFSG